MMAGRHVRRAWGSATPGVHIPHANAYPIAGMVKDFRPTDYPQDEPMVPQPFWGCSANALPWAKHRGRARRASAGPTNTCSFWAARSAPFGAGPRWFRQPATFLGSALAGCLLLSAYCLPSTAFKVTITRDDHLVLFTKLSLWPLAILSAIFGVMLFLFPGHTDTLWSWQIKPDSQ